MTSDGSPWRSTQAEFDPVGFSLVKRDIEVLMLAIKRLSDAVGLVTNGQPNTAAESVNPTVTSVTGPAGPAGSAGPAGPEGPAGADGTIPLGPGGETMSIITITGCVDGVEKTIYVYGYVVP